MLRASAMVGDSVVTKELVQRMKTDGRTVTPQMKSSILNAYRQSESYNELVSLFEEMRADNALDKSSWDVRINAAQSPSEAFEFYTQSAPRDARLYASALRKCAGELKYVTRIWSDVTVSVVVRVNVLTLSFQNDQSLEHALKPAERTQLHCAYIVARCACVFEAAPDSLSADMLNETASDVLESWYVLRTSGDGVRSPEAPIAFYSSARLVMRTVWRVCADCGCALGWIRARSLARTALAAARRSHRSV
jgi:hypothetical protein